MYLVGSQILYNTREDCFPSNGHCHIIYRHTELWIHCWKEDKEWVFYCVQETPLPRQREGIIVKWKRYQLDLEDISINFYCFQQFSSGFYFNENLREMPAFLHFFLDVILWYLFLQLWQTLGSDREIEMIFISIYIKKVVMREKKKLIKNVFLVLLYWNVTLNETLI